MEAHFAALEHLKGVLPNKPTAMDVAQALAAAFGDAMGLAAMSGAAAHQLVEVNEIANQHYNSTMATIVADTKG